jgi:hypothetical protein
MGGRSWKSVVILAALAACSADAVTAAVPNLVSIVVALNSAALTVGQTTIASATIRDAGAPAPGEPVVWASSSAAVATVSSAGVVTAVGPGTTNISAMAEGATGSAPLTVEGPAAPPTIVFRDGFEGGTLSYAQNGVRWSGTSWVDVSTSIAHSGSHAARFRQGESTNWGELRFDGLPNLSEAYIQFWIYFPSGTESPSVGSKVQVLGGKNDKFFRLWGNKDADYGALPGDKVGASTWGDGSGQDGKLGVEYQYTPPTGAQWGMGEGDVPQGRVSFINDANRGRWVRIRIHAKVASAANNDGVVQIWTDDKLILSRTTLHSYPGAGAPNTFTTGYLLGAANNGFVPGQYTYIDDVVFSSGGFTTP